MDRRESIVVDIGGDASKLLKEFNVSKNGARQWAQDVAKELTQGRLPDSWKAYTNNVREALRTTDAAAKTTESSVDRLSKGFGRLAGSLIGFAVVKRVFNEALSVMKELGAELAKLDKRYDTAPYLQKKRSDEIGSMSDFDKGNVVAGNVMMEDLKNRIGTGLAKALAGIDLGSKVWANYIFGKNDLGYSMNFGEATEAAVKEQNLILDGIKAAALEKEAAEAKDKQAAARAAHDRKVIENFTAYENKMRERNRINAEQERTLLKEKLRLQKAITEEYLRQHQAGGVLGYKVARPQLGETVGELNAAGPDEGRTVYDGLNEYRRRTSRRMDLWMQHGRDASNGVRSIRQPRDPNPNQSNNSDVVAELQKLTNTLPAGGLPVKVKLDN